MASAIVYLIWYYVIWHFPEYKKYTTASPNMEMVVVLVGITVLYLFLYLLILFSSSFQTPWKSFLLISIITILSFFIIPSGYFAKYEVTKTMEKIEAKRKRVNDMAGQLNKVIALNMAANKSIMELQTQLESEREENDRLKKQLNGTIGKTISPEKKRNIKGSVLVQAIPNKNISRRNVNSAAGRIDLDPKPEEIKFKVQILSSSNRLADDSPEFKGLKNISEYKEGNLYKYTVGNRKDLKSASSLQSELQKKGFEGAFVAAFKNGKRLPIREALKLLK
jgi:FlaA1/EpsC-like NDP-sugar epimerase